VQGLQGRENYQRVFSESVAEGLSDLLQLCARAQAALGQSQTRNRALAENHAGGGVVNHKLAGIISGGPYIGQKYKVIGTPYQGNTVPGWIGVYLEDERGHCAVREVRERFLEVE
jgi:hypothetical protein